MQKKKIFVHAALRGTSSQKKMFVGDVSWNKSPRHIGMRKTLFDPTEPEMEPEKDLQSYYKKVRNKYLQSGDPEDLNGLNKKWNDDRINKVRFHGTKYGRVQYFKKCLVAKLGTNWSGRVLNPKDRLSDVRTVERLGVPGREGTTIKIQCGGKDYAVKVLAKGTYCGEGIEQTLEEAKIHADNPKESGFLYEARLQQLASEHNVTVPVEAVHCGGKDEASFLVMSPLKTRLKDYYQKNQTLSLKHQKQLWNLFKTLDEEVGIVHNDYNCLNIMVDSEDNIKLIDFGRSRTILKQWIIKSGPYPNLLLMRELNCFHFYKTPLPGQKLLANYHRLFGCKLKFNVGINNLQKFKDLDRREEYNGGRNTWDDEARQIYSSRLKPYETLGINWDPPR